MASDEHEDPYCASDRFRAADRFADRAHEECLGWRPAVVGAFMAGARWALQLDAKDAESDRRGVRAANPDATPAASGAPETAGAAPPRDGWQHTAPDGFHFGKSEHCPICSLPATGAAPPRETEGGPPSPEVSRGGAASASSEWVLGSSGGAVPIGGDDDDDDEGDDDGWTMGGGAAVPVTAAELAKCRARLEAERVRYRRALGLLVDVARVARSVVEYVDKEAEIR